MSTCRLISGSLIMMLNNENFGFEWRQNSQNKSFNLIYDEEAEIESISKYGRHVSDNCFLSLKARITKLENTIEIWTIWRRMNVQMLKHQSKRRLSR